jgi:hypothetical protein
MPTRGIWKGGHTPVKSIIEPIPSNTPIEKERPIEERPIEERPILPKETLLSKEESPSKAAEFTEDQLRNLEGLITGLKDKFQDKLFEVKPFDAFQKLPPNQLAKPFAIYLKQFVQKNKEELYKESCKKLEKEFASDFIKNFAAKNESFRRFKTNLREDSGQME